MTDRERADTTQPFVTPRADAGETLAQDALPPMDADGPPREFGRYRLERLLGQGAMGAVYQAHDTQLDRRVALKVPLTAGGAGSKARERFDREARAAATLRHPGICPVYDVGEFVGTPYLTMAFIDGRPLADLIPKGGWPDPAAAGEIVRKVAVALAEAHRHGVVHRDLKSANVMLDAAGEPIVTDFGLARRESPTDARLTQDGAILGTPAYMAPEQARGEPAGPPCDVYALGVILYEMLTGTIPFDGNSVAVVAKVLTEEPKPIEALRPDTPPRLAAICRMAMAKKPAERFASMTAFADALAGGGTVRLDRRRQRWPFVAAGAVAVLALAAVGLNAFRATPDEPIVVPTDRAELMLAAKEVLERNCADCHNQAHPRSGDFEFIFDVPKLIDHKLIRPGDADRSKLVLRVVNDEMPPKDVKSPRPTAQDAAILRAWVAAGAPPFEP
ncbi:MAG: protein kinase [Gemmataceae bacterium]